MNEEVNVILMNLPNSIHGFSRKNPDGSFTVVLNSRMDSESQRETYLHEITHIRMDDFDDADVGAIEHFRHEKTAV